MPVSRRTRKTRVPKTVNFSHSLRSSFPPRTSKLGSLTPPCIKTSFRMSPWKNLSDTTAYLISRTSAEDIFPQPPYSAIVFAEDAKQRTALSSHLPSIQWLSSNLQSNVRAQSNIWTSRAETAPYAAISQFITSKAADIDKSPALWILNGHEDLKAIQDNRNFSLLPNWDPSDRLGTLRSWREGLAAF